jgi:hypothetical protein
MKSFMIQAQASLLGRISTSNLGLALSLTFAISLEKDARKEFLFRIN